MSRVVVGLSGGVDSSVAAYMLKRQGHEVIGLFMRNWHEEDENGVCTSEIDYSDVKRVCACLDIPYYSIDFSKEYYDRVFENFVDEYKKGRTPNPDVLCNREIKFGPFLSHAFKLGADYVATGHYAGIKRENGRTYLTRAKDENKDQTYFLNQLTEKQIERVMFPLENMFKSEVRETAFRIGIPVADKKDSTGVCFIGERNFRKFLSEYIPMKEGNIVYNGKVIGKHNGVYYYTLGQRRGLGIGGDTEGDRWFVIDKDVKKNILYVSKGEDDCLYKSALITEGFNFINGAPDTKEFDCTARIRHRQTLEKARAKIVGSDVKLVFERPQRAIVAGQYAVIYDGMRVLGGGVIGSAE